MFQRILIPLDGSPRAEQAVPVAAPIARASGGSVLLLQVVSPPIDYGGGLAQAPLMMEQVIETELAVASRYVDRVAKAPKPPPMSCSDCQPRISWPLPSRGRWT